MYSELPGKKRSKEEGHLAQLIRRKMMQKDHGDKSKYIRKDKHKNKSYE